ncbi:MAG TPA: bifunctional nuclease family protein [Anaerolineae bacterium]|nr:bifunctional nuclease family protein [Anaerolineae bacterium]
MIEMTVDALQMSLVSPHRVVILREVDTERYLPIWIGPCEAEAIVMHLNRVEMPRPMTHDLLTDILERLQARLNYVYINALTDSTFFAELSLDVNGRKVVIDSRPSDAIAIAVRTGATVYVAEEVLEEAGVVPEPDLTMETEDSELDIFRDFLNTLNLDTPPYETA